MEFSKYQIKAHETAQYPNIYVENTTFNLLYPILGLVGETGEIAEKVKKIVRNYHGEFSEDQLQNLKLELGDILWYLAETATILGFSLENIAIENLEKLSSRRRRGVICSEGDNR